MRCFLNRFTFVLLFFVSIRGESARSVSIFSVSMLSNSFDKSLLICVNLLWCVLRFAILCCLVASSSCLGSNGLLSGLFSACWLVLQGSICSVIVSGWIFVHVLVIGDRSFLSWIVLSSLSSKTLANLSIALHIVWFESCIIFAIFHFSWDGDDFDFIWMSEVSLSTSSFLN